MLTEDSSLALSASVEGAAVVRPRALPINGLDRAGEARLTEVVVVLASSLFVSAAGVVRPLAPALPPNLGRENPDFECVAGLDSSLFTFSSTAGADVVLTPPLLPKLGRLNFPFLVGSEGVSVVVVVVVLRPPKPLRLPPPNLPRPKGAGTSVVVVVVVVVAGVVVVVVVVLVVVVVVVSGSAGIIDVQIEIGRRYS